MKAKEAHSITTNSIYAQQSLERLDAQREFEFILEKIKKEAESGKYCVYIKNVIKPGTILLLKDHGYEVSPSILRDGTYHIYWDRVSWWKKIYSRIN